MSGEKQAHLILSRKNSGDRNNRKRVGKLIVRTNENGNLTVYGKNILGGKRYIGSPDGIRDLALREMSKKGHISRTTYDRIRNLGYLNKSDQRRHIDAGVEFLGIEVKTRSDILKESYLKKADIAFRKFWKKRECEKAVRGQNLLQRKRIQDFRAKEPAAYKWIKFNGGMLDFMEERRPGLYRLLSEKVTQYSIDLKRLGEDLTREISRGLPISRSGLYRSENKVKRKLYHQIEFALKNKLLPEKCEKFNDALSYLTGLSTSEIRAMQNGAKELGKLGEKYVAFYLTWAIRAGYDPLKLDLPDLSKIRLGYKETRFTYGGGRKGWADARIGSSPVEVKVGTLPLNGDFLKEIVSKYSPKSRWNDGTFMGKPYLFLHQKPNLYEKHTLEFEKKGIRVIGFNEFHDAFLKLIGKVANNYPNVFENASPSINMDALVNAHKSLNLESRLSVFSRSGLHTERQWYLDSLRYLISAGDY